MSWLQIWPEEILPWGVLCVVSYKSLRSEYSYICIYILRLSSPVYQVCDALVQVLCIYCICDWSPASRTALVAQLVRVTPRKRTVVGSSPTRGSFFVFCFKKQLPWVSCVVLLCLSVVLCCLVILSKHLMDD